MRWGRPGVSPASSGSSRVLVDHAAEDFSAGDRNVEWDGAGRIVVWWLLVDALVWPVVVEMSVVLSEDGGGRSL
jgi:hypothetical protein